MGDGTRRVVVAGIAEWDGLRRWFDGAGSAKEIGGKLVEYGYLWCPFPVLTRFTRVLSKRGGSLAN